MMSERVGKIAAKVLFALAAALAVAAVLAVTVYVAPLAFVITAFSLALVASAACLGLGILLEKKAYWHDPIFRERQKQLILEEANEKKWTLQELFEKHGSTLLRHKLLGLAEIVSHWEEDWDEYYLDDFLENYQELKPLLIGSEEEREIFKKKFLKDLEDRIKLKESWGAEAEAEAEEEIYEGYQGLKGARKFQRSINAQLPDSVHFQVSDEQIMDLLWDREKKVLRLLGVDMRCLTFRTNR